MPAREVVLRFLFKQNSEACPFSTLSDCFHNTVVTCSFKFAGAWETGHVLLFVLGRRVGECVCIRVGCGSVWVCARLCGCVCVMVHVAVCVLMWVCVHVYVRERESLVPPGPVCVFLKQHPRHPDLRTHRREHVVVSHLLCILGYFLSTVSLFCVSSFFSRLG